MTGDSLYCYTFNYKYITACIVNEIQITVNEEIVRNDKFVIWLC
jgi:hypothetical protein